jgi:hypothetical protein
MTLMPSEVLVTQLVTPSSFRLPAHFVGSAWTGHAPFASWIIDAARPGTVVELGTHNGFSLFSFAEAVRDLGLDTQVIGVDIWTGDDHSGFYGEEVFASVNQIVAQDYEGIVHLYRKTFDEAAADFADGEIDLLHIDGRHGYEDVKHDFESYRDKLSPRAVVLFHDTHEFERGFGVHQFWAEIADTAPSFEFHHSHGLGVLAIGSEAPTAVLQFIEEANADPEGAREIYSSLGAIVMARSALESEAAYLRAVKDELLTEIDKMRRTASWRWTTPLRKARVFAGRVTGRRGAVKPTPQSPAG